MADVRIVTLNGGAKTLGSTRVERFRGRLQGELLRPGEDGYEAARKVWNGMVDKRPAMIARCIGTADVVACVNFAREHDILTSVRGGGHNYAGKSVSDGGLMIDLSPMKDIKVDPERRIARAQTGLKLGEFDRETQRFGLATTLGVNSITGIAGLTLGGGYGWLAGKHGLACDNVLSLEVVTADGKLVTANAHENDDLFWGMRGAGANFGIATSFEYQLHPVGPVLGGMVLYPMSDGEEVLRFFDEFSSTCPDEVSTAAFLLTAPSGEPAVAIVACYCGSIGEGEKVLTPLRKFSWPMADLIQPRSYVEIQTLFDEAWPPGLWYYNKTHIVRRGTPDVVATCLSYARERPTPLSVIGFQQLHGAASRVDSSETAFPHRFDHHAAYVHPIASDPADCARMIQWAKQCWSTLQPLVELAAYVNAVEDAEEEGGEERVRVAYGPNYDRLRMLKRRYDPDNFFRLNQNIKPSE
jgi:FAD/FMN-containing dehydrogenase